MCKQEHGERILIVDAVADRARETAALLREEKYKTNVALMKSGRMPKVKDCDLILLDMDRVEYALMLQKKYPGVPVIFMVSQPEPEEIRQVYALGGCDYVERPFVKERFLTRIDTQLHNAGQMKKIEEMKTEMGDFYGAVSHDLKAPFTVIPCLISLLKEEMSETPNDQAEGIMNDIMHESRETRALIEDIYELSKVHNLPELADE